MFHQILITKGKGKETWKLEFLMQLCTCHRCCSVFPCTRRCFKFPTYYPGVPCDPTDNNMHVSCQWKLLLFIFGWISAVLVLTGFRNFSSLIFTSTKLCCPDDFSSKDPGLSCLNTAPRLSHLCHKQILKIELSTISKLTGECFCLICLIRLPLCSFRVDVKNQVMI